MKRTTRRVVIRNRQGMISEIRREAPVFPEGRGGRRLVGLFVLVLVLALVNVWVSGRYYRTGYSVSAALEERKHLRREIDLLKTEIQSLRNPSRIESIAKNELGMVDPKTDRIMRVP